MSWRWLTFEAGEMNVIGHAVHTDRLQAVIDDLVARGCGAPQTVDLPELWLDMPGMVSTKRPWEDFALEGLELHIPSEDVATFFLKLQTLKVRTGDYFKLKGFHRALVVSTEQRDLLIAMMSARLAVAEQRASAFYAVTPTASDVLKQIAAKTNNIPIEQVPDLGGNKNNRFRFRGTRGLA